MKINDIIKNPLTWLILIIIILIIVSFMLSRSHPTNIKTCNSQEELISGKCVGKCPDGQIRCGTTISCYDPLQQYCDNSTYQICGISNKNCNKCCPDGYSCLNGTCKPCDSKFVCGEKCCNDNTPNCCNKNECCTKDATCTKIDGCCEAPNTVCGDHCCNAGADLTCIENKCQISCPPINPKTNKLPDGFTGVPIACDTNTSICFQNPSIKDINKQYQCLPKGCEWGDFYYTPSQDYLDADNKPVHVCNDKNNSLWISKQNMNDLESTVNVSIKNFNKDKCTNDTCFQKIYQDGSTELKGLNVQKISNGQIKDNTCTSELLCSELLLPYTQDNLKNVCENENSKLYGQCCIVDNKYSGQICPEGSKCLVDTCVKIGVYDSYCNNNGKTDFKNNQIVCDCNKPVEIYDTLCNKIESSSYYDANFFINYLNNTVPSLNGWENFFVFIVSNEITNWNIIDWSKSRTTLDSTQYAQSILKRPITQALYETNGSLGISFQIKDSSNNFIGWATYERNSGSPYWQIQTGKQPGGEPESTLNGVKYKFYNSGDLGSASSPCFVIYAGNYVDGSNNAISTITCKDYYSKNFFSSYIRNQPSSYNGWTYLYVFIVCNNIKKWQIIDWGTDRTSGIIPAKDFNYTDVTQATYYYYSGKDISFQIKDKSNNFIAWATLKNTSPYWQLQTGKQPGGEPVTDLSGVTYIFYNSGDLFPGSAACLVIIAAKNTDGEDN